MSRNGSGVYSLPAGSTVTNGDTSDATDLNTPLADLEADANIPRPIVAGGTGASSAAAALVNLGLTATAAEINVLDGITASTAELNILDGVTATATELNYVDGVTSAIQTQLDTLTSAKQAQDAFLDDIAALTDPGGTRGLGWDDTANEVVWQQPPLGVGQTWQVPTRAKGTTYQNTTGRPIQVSIWGDNYTFQVSEDNVSWTSLIGSGSSGADRQTFAVIPDTHYYRATNDGAGTLTWRELRV